MGKEVLEARRPRGIQARPVEGLQDLVGVEPALEVLGGKLALGLDGLDIGLVAVTRGGPGT